MLTRHNPLLLYPVRASTIAIACAVFLASAEAQPQAPTPDPTLKPKITEVLANKLVIPATYTDTQLPSGKYTSAGCALTITASEPRTIEGPSGCDALWQLAPGREVKLTLTSEIGAKKLLLELASFAPTRPALPSGEKKAIVELKPGEELQERSKAGQKQVIVDAFTPNKESTYWVVDAQGGAEFVQLPEIWPPVVDGSKYKIAALITDLDAKAKCEGTEGFKSKRSLCFRVGDGLEPHLVYAPPRLSDHILPPNTSLLVFVIHDASVTIDVQLGGQRGFYAPTTDARDGQANALLEKKTEPVTVEVTRKEFSPRLPGSNADLVVKASKGAEMQTKTHEMYVETTYSGALRLGLGVVLSPGAVDRDYKAERVDNSTQHEIVAGRGGRTEFELVVGYAPFLFDGRKGRSYTNTTLRQRAGGFAPYFGLGLLNVASPTGLEFLKSVHFGIEWEPQRNVTFAVTAILRRITELRPGYAVGSPVAGTDAPTRERIGLGLGVVINFTPEFLRFATRPRSELLGGNKE